MSRSTTDESIQVGRRGWLVLAVLALPALLVSLDLSVLLVALPSLSAALGASIIEQLWIVDVYGFVVAGLLITAGTLGDRIGRRRLLIAGGAVFGLVSIVAAFSVSPAMLIVCRALLGVAGACLMPSALALAGGLFPDPKRSGLAMSVVFSAIMAGGALGPVIGGILLQFFWWGSIFLMAVPVMLLLVVVGPRLLPEFSNPDAGRLDPTSVVLSLGAILAVVYGVKELAKDGLSTLPVAALVIGIVLGVAFVVRQSRLAEPLLDVALFRGRPFSAAVGFMLGGGILMGGIFLVATSYLQLVGGLSPLAAGLAMLAPSIASTIGVILGPGLAARIRPAFVMAGGMIIAAIGLATAALVSTGDVLLLVIGLTVALFGMGIPGGLGIGMIIGSAPPERAGSASSVSSTSQELGVAFGLAVVGSLATAVYGSTFSNRVPAGVPADAAEATGDSLAQVFTVAAGLPDRVGAELVLSAQGAYTQALQVCFGAGAVVALALGALVAFTLRHVPASPAPSTT